jgi:hypothetical protein
MGKLPHVIDAFTPLTEIKKPQVDGAYTPFLQRE